MKIGLRVLLGNPMFRVYDGRPSFAVEGGGDGTQVHETIDNIWSTQSRLAGTEVSSKFRSRTNRISP
jgi:hypothetical protein